MNLLWVELPLLVALAVHIAICVLLVTAVGAFVLRLSRGASAPLRHTLALAILAATLLVPGIASLCHWRVGLPTTLAPTRAGSITQPTAQVTDARPAALDEPATSGWASGSRTIQWSFLVSGLLVVVWITGSAVLALRTLLAFGRQRRYLASLHPVRCKRTRQAMERLRKQIGIRRSVALFVAPQTPWAFTVGILRPKVIVPKSLLTDSGPSQIEAVLTHELAHVYRFDCAVAMLENAVVLLFWWIPFVYNVRSTLLNAREKICDAFVLSYSGDGEPLAEYLIQSVERAANARLAWGVGLSAEEPHIVEQRVTHLLFGDERQMLRISSLLSGLIVAAALVISIGLVFADYARAELILGTPVNLGPNVNSKTAVDDGAEISSDGLTLYFSSKRNGTMDIFVSQRDSILNPWQPAVPVPSLSDGEWNEISPTVTADGLLMMFHANVPGSSLQSDIYQSTRSSISDPWGAPVSAGAAINTAGNDRYPSLSPDGLALYLASSRHSASSDGEALDIYVATRPSRGVPFGEPTNLGDVVNSDRGDAGASISSDGLRLFFHSTRDSVAMSRPFDQDIFYSERASINGPWAPAIKLDSVVNSGAPENLPSISADGTMLYFGRWTSDNLESSDIFAVRIIPEPSTTMMLVAGSLLLLGFIPRRRKPWCRR